MTIQSGPLRWWIAGIIFVSLIAFGTKSVSLLDPKFEIQKATISSSNADSGQKHVSRDSAEKAAPPPILTTHPTSPQQQEREVWGLDKIEETVASIEELASTHELGSLAKIEPFLYSKHLAIREAAVNAILNLGFSSGADVLSRATRSMLDPKEEKETMEKAAFLRLPTGQLRARKLPN